MKRIWFGATAGLLITILESGCQPNNLPMPTESAIPAVISTSTLTLTSSPVPPNAAVVPTNTTVPTSTAIVPVRPASNSQRIVFSRRTHTEEGDILLDLYLVNSDGSGLTNITNSPELDELVPVWLPGSSGVQFVGLPHTTYVAGSSIGAAIYQMHFDGSPPVKLAEFPYHDVGFVPDISFSWSPDRTHVAFLVGDPFEVHMMKVDGSEEINTGLAYFPSWSPSSTELVVTSVGNASPVFFILKKFDLAGNLLGFNDSVLGVSAAWSPDGSHIACFCSINYAGDRPLSDLCVMDNQGDYRVWVANVNTHLADLHLVVLKWSPDGTHIAAIDLPTRVFLLGTEDSDLTEIYSSQERHELEYGGPAWSPDSLKMAFPCNMHREDSATNTRMGICVFDMSTKTVARITHDESTVDTQLDWEP